MESYGLLKTLLPSSALKKFELNKFESFPHCTMYLIHNRTAPAFPNPNLTRTLQKNESNVFVRRKVNSISVFQYCSIQRM